MEEFGFVDLFLESEAKPIEKIMVVVKEIPNLVYFVMGGFS